MKIDRFFYNTYKFEASNVNELYEKCNTLTKNGIEIISIKYTTPESTDTSYWYTVQVKEPYKYV